MSQATGVNNNTKALLLKAISIIIPLPVDWKCCVKDAETVRLWLESGGFKSAWAVTLPSPLPPATPLHPPSHCILTLAAQGYLRMNKCDHKSIHTLMLSSFLRRWIRIQNSYSLYSSQTKKLNLNTNTAWEITEQARMATRPDQAIRKHK